MKATTNLENDHVHILRLIDVMEQVCAQQDPQVDHLEQIVDLIRNFADGFHHAKEENLLFPKMVEKGFSLEQGPIAAMVYEHTLGRNFVQSLADNIPFYRAGNKSVLNDIINNMQGYSNLLRAHISKENNVLFKMADNLLTEGEQDELMNHFNRIVKNPSSGVSAAEYIQRIDILAEAYKIR